ncbi:MULTISPECIES: toxin VasX, partial [unclassified Pseudomonas]
MTDFMTPRGHMANLVALSKSATPFGEIGVCPLTKTTIQLLPMRYGLVEPGLDPRADMAMPYTLQSRPLGLRMLRNGFLYVIDSATGLLSEYTVKDGSLEYWLFTGKDIKEHRTPLGDPPEMIFSRRSVLHVAYAETQWAVAKCWQVLDNASEREHFMQRVDLTQANSENIVAPLIHQRHVKKWLAEVVRDHPMPQDGITPDENRPYQWEHPPLFRQTIIEELTSQVNNAQKMDYLFLAVRDDLGVMRDLANYQDKVVGWIGDWASSGEQAGNTERDYLLACYIESLSQISVANLTAMALDSPDPAVKALMHDLEKLPEPQRGQTAKALVDFLTEDPVAHPLPGVSDQNLPADLEAQLQKIRLTADRNNAYSVLPKLEQTIERYFLKQKLAIAGPDFIARHGLAILQIDRQQDKRLRDLLYGAGFGRRGINDLIDRPRMDAFLEEQRPKLAH